MREERRRGQTTAQHLREQILQLVKERDLRPGDRIPTEAELKERFGGSRPTIREALKLLEQDGVLHVTHGHGRTLTAAGSLDVERPITRFESITEMGAALGMTYDTRVLGLEEERPTPDLVRTLRLQAGEGVVRLERLRLHGGDPMIYCVTRVRRSAIPRRPFELDWSGSLLDILERFGPRPRMSSARVSARPLPPDVVARHGLGDFGTALLIEETALTTAGVPVLAAEDWHRGSRFAFGFARR